MTFSSEELLEIEKVFDNMAGMLSNSVCKQLEVLIKFEKKQIVKKHITNLLDENFNTWNVFREISKKARIMQYEEDSKNNYKKA